jgi:hypothetical protein
MQLQTKKYENFLLAYFTYDALKEKQHISKPLPKILNYGPHVIHIVGWETICSCLLLTCFDSEDGGST